jgi:hypothetical protein
MTLWTARQKAEAEYKAAVREWKANPTQRNADRLKIKRALFESLQRWIARNSYGGVRWVN